MINSRCPWLIAIAISINCADSGRLSPEENLKRIKNCGKPELPTPAEGEKLEGSKVTFGDNSYIVRVKTLNHAEYFTTGFFISPRHILTSSQSVFNEERRLRFNSTYQITKGACTMEVPSKYNKEIEVILHNEQKTDDKKNVFKIKSATLLAFCVEDTEFIKFFSPMLVELKENQTDVKFPCVADSTTEIKVNDEVHAYRWKGKRVFPQKVMEIYSDSYYFKRKIEDVQEKLIATPKKQYKGNVRGGPLVMHKTPKGTLAIGIDATTGFNDSAQSTYYHNIKALEGDLCKFAGVCTPTLLPPTTVTTATPEEEATTLNPNAQLSIDPSPSDSSEPSTSMPTKSSPVASKKSTTPPQKSIDEFEVAPEDILYDEDKRRAEEPDVNNDFFVSADFMTDSDGKIGLYWTVGTLVMVLLV